MFKINDLRELIRAVDRSNIDELIVKGENNEKIEIRKRNTKGVVQEQMEVVATPQVLAAPQVLASPAPVAQIEQPAAAPLVDEKLHKITSPMVGTFYESPSPEEGPYMKKGDKVNADTVVCIVEAMKLMNELEAEIEGEIVEILVENGQLVEYGQPLFLVKV
ncbi:acetyl-CoA carboxylase biotin carboxyl carrier protein [Bacillaceae bacterium IKA-2]|jgi:acetyl-CoA carboxylase biotin carboxyl carrier protein|nr:acetyl-CoA carboxylase biotin carboxyl carrier protein [Bacillaceae bacterium IKA-2]